MGTHILLVPQTSPLHQCETVDRNVLVDQNYPELSAMFIVTVFCFHCNNSVPKTRFYQLKKHEDSVRNQTKPKVEIKKSAKTAVKPSSSLFSDISSVSSVYQEGQLDLS